MEKSRYFLICGNDLYQSKRSLEAVISRFRQRDNNLTDLARFDLEEASIATLQRALLTVPFLVTHRLFIITHAFNASKTVQGELITLFEHASSTTVVVLYESKPCDKRLSLYSWLTKHGKVQDYAIPDRVGLLSFIGQIGRQHNVTFEPAAQQFLVTQFGRQTLQLVSEIQKLSNFVQSQAKSHITIHDVRELCHGDNEESLFALSDALRDGDMKQSILLSRHLLRQHDPMLLAATLASLIRTFAKLKLAEAEEGNFSPPTLAKRTGLNPYVIKLAASTARFLSLQTIQSSYRELITFDRRVKSGFVNANLGFLLLVIRLHVTLNKDRSRNPS